MLLEPKVEALEPDLFEQSVQMARRELKPAKGQIALKVRQETVNQSERKII